MARRAWGGRRGVWVTSAGRKWVRINPEPDRARYIWKPSRVQKLQRGWTYKY